MNLVATFGAAFFEPNSVSALAYPLLDIFHHRAVSKLLIASL
jgi:hypothetical protein